MNDIGPKINREVVSTEAQPSVRKRQLLVIFLTVFIDLVGFGIIIPLSPYLAVEYGATPLEVGLLMSVYSFMQFLFAPVWGKISDRIGRRPVLLVSIFGGMLSYLGFAFASHLWVLFIARAFAGLFGANISTAMAYIADVTEEKNRSKGMGLIGAAFGLGFVLGPFLGAESGHFGTTLGSTPPLGIQFSAILASALCLVNFIFAFFYLKESLQPEDRRQARRSGRLALLKLHITRPVVGQLMVIFLLSGLSMAHMESTLFLWVKDEWGWGLRLAGLGFAYVGVMIAFTQGYLIRRLMPKLGEKKLMTLGLALLGLGFWGVNLSSSVWILGVTMTLIALGNGLGNPAILGSVSLLTPKEQQGETMGVTHSLSALARIIGPALGGWFYGHYSHGMPFWVAGGLTFLALIMVLKLYSRLPEKGLESSLSQSSVRD